MHCQIKCFNSCIYFDIVDNMDDLYFSQSQTFLGGEIVEKSDKVIDIVLGALNIEHQQT